MKLEIQRVNQKINKLEELMTNFLEQISRNNLQLATQPAPQVGRRGKGSRMENYQNKRDQEKENDHYVFTLQSF